jgi:hypothetical protein
MGAHRGNSADMFGGCVMSRTADVHGPALQTGVGSTTGRRRVSETIHHSRRFFAALLLAVALLFGGATSARADAFVVFSDSSLRAAVATQLERQGQIPLGSNGTTITASDMETVTALSAPNRDVVRLDGLQYASNLTTLDLSGNEIASITVLGGLTNLTELDVSRNDLDLSPGSLSTAVVVALEGLGVHVSDKPQRARLSKLTVPSSASKYGTRVTFSASVVPGAAGLLGTSEVRLYHLETKTVTQRIKGRKRKVRVNYWRLRDSLTMRANSNGALSVQGKLPYAGRWQAWIDYASPADYESCKSAVTPFVVQDPRIQAAISWAMRRLGSHAWDHYCLKFVCDCYASGAHATVRRYQTARQAASALHASAHPRADAPRGAWVFYDSTALGHVGISLGNGTMINDYGGAGVKVMRIKSAGHYIGWAAPPLSPPISDWDKPT